MLSLVLQLALAPAVAGLANGIGRLPAMGWNSWNAYHCDITEAKFLDAADKIVSLGLKVGEILIYLKYNSISNKIGRRL